MSSARASHYNYDNTYQWFRPRVKKLEDDAAYDPSVWMAAMGRSRLWDEEFQSGSSLNAPTCRLCTERSQLLPVKAWYHGLQSNRSLHSYG
jgi:hypothetical protein